MDINVSEKFAVLVSLIKEVKPGIGDADIKVEHRLIDDLGLDSLDVLQLVRRVNREIGPVEVEDVTGPKATVGLLLNLACGLEPAGTEALA